MNQITPQIWIGNSHDASQPHQAGFSHVLNCAHDLNQKVGWANRVRHFHVGMVDGANHPALYAAALNILDAICADPGAKVLVHCHEGRSRSVYVVALYLVSKQIKLDMDQALEYIRQCGRDVSVAGGHFDSFRL